MSFEIESAATLKAEMERGYNLFTGAGFSVCAKNAKGQTLPLGNELADGLRRDFDVDPSASLSLPQIYLILHSTRPEDLNGYIQELFRVETFDPNYAFLQQLSPRSILTTNVDDLIQKIFLKDPKHYLNDVYRQGASLHSRESVDILQVHGSIDDAGRPMLFSQFDISSAFADDPDQWQLLRQKISEQSTIFWGYSFADPSTLQALRSRSGRGARPAIGDAWVQIRPQEADNGLGEFYRALGYKLIIGDTQNLLSYFNHLVDGIPLKVQPRAVLDENIPSYAEATIRPIEDFFLGASPSWSDVQSGQLHQTQHYSRIVESIQSGRNSVLAGIPGCGKTTLLMQVAAHLHANKTKHYRENLGAEEAAMLSRRIGQGAAIIFLDNVAGDIAALEALSANPNVQVVAADRDFSLSSVLHRVIRLNYEIIGVTPQDRADLVSVWRTIPLAMRQRSQVFPPTTYGGDPSLYEFVQANVRGSSLSSRLSEHLLELSQMDYDQAELLVLACYLGYARSSLSTDIGMTYFHARSIEYARLIEMVQAVGELLNDDPWGETDQDYFTSRSSLVNEEVLKRCQGSLLRTVLENFFLEVSPLRIPRLPSFRRYGFKSSLFARAFPDTQQAIALYDVIFDKYDDFDQSGAYVLQQKALFLGRKGFHEAAFHEIDRAQSMRSRRRNYTIENTYNKLLFRANLDKAAGSKDALDACIRALKNLQVCFANDVPQGPHAYVYADCAMRLSEEAPSTETTALLREAEDMLAAVAIREPFMNRTRQISKEVRSQLAAVT